jgi:hypothetical protein
MSSVPRIGIAVQTWNRLDYLKLCFPTWRAVPNAFLAICDAGSDDETLGWLCEQDMDWVHYGSNLNPAQCYNRMLTMFRFSQPDIEYILLGTPDFELHDGAVPAMVELMDASADAGFIGWQQANYGKFVHNNGYVWEIGHECLLQRQRMWQEIGLYTETLGFYHCDSCQSTIANQYGWRTRLVDAVWPDKSPGYIHHGRDTHTDTIEPLRAKDHQRWIKLTDNMFNFWRGKIEREG